MALFRGQIPEWDHLAGTCILQDMSCLVLLQPVDSVLVNLTLPVSLHIHSTFGVEPSEKKVLSCVGSSQVL